LKVVTETSALWGQQLREALLGAPLTSVEFVQDYVQLRFDGPVLTVITWPLVDLHEHEVRWGERGFRNELCSRIGEKVIRAEILPRDSLQLEFGDGAIFKVSLRDEDYRAAEAVRFESDPATWWVL